MGEMMITSWERLGIILVMSEWMLTLLGQPSLRQDGHVVELKSRKGWALLAYLAVHSEPIPREQIATLFWPERDGAAGRRNLRRLLYTLNQSAVAPFLQTEGETIGLNFEGAVDVQAFAGCVEREDWETAASLLSEKDSE